MIKIKKNKGIDRIELDLDLELNSSKLYATSFNVKIKNFSVNNNEEENLLGIINMTIPEDYKLIIYSNKKYNINSDLILELNDYKELIDNKIKEKREKIESERIEYIRNAFKNHIKFKIEYFNMIGYLINGVDAFDDNFLELEAAMNNNDLKIQEKYPDIKNSGAELTLAEIVELTNFKSKRKSNNA